MALNPRPRSTYHYLFDQFALIEQVMIGTVKGVDLNLFPQGPSTQDLRTLVPKTINGMFLEPDTSTIGYLDPLGFT